MTDTTEAKTFEAPPAPTGDDLKALLRAVPANPNLLEFPTDRWGVTNEIRSAILRAGSSIRGQQDKQDLVVATMLVLLQHIRVRFPVDQMEFAERMAHINAAADERRERERVSGSLVPKQDDA